MKYDIPDDELSRSKEFWKGRMQLRLEDTRALASWMGGQELLLGRIMTVEEVIATVDSIAVEDVQRVAKELFVSDRLNLALISPRGSAVRLERLLKF